MTTSNTQKTLIGLLLAFGAMFAACCGGCVIMMGVASNRVAEAEKAEQERIAALPEDERELYLVEKNARDSQIFLESDAERAVKKVLKSPDSATFSSYPSIAVLGPKGFSVKGEVTSKNSFNASIRDAYFVVLYREDPSDNHAKAVFVQVGEQSMFIDKGLYDRCMKEASAFNAKHGKRH